MGGKSLKHRRLERLKEAIINKGIQLSFNIDMFRYKHASVEGRKEYKNAINNLLKDLYEQDFPKDTFQGKTSNFIFTHMKDLRAKMDEYDKKNT